MENFLIQQLESALVLATFWIIYRSFLSNETFFHFNRYFLIGGIFLAFILPCFQIRYEVAIEIPLEAGATTSPASTLDSSLTTNKWMIGIILYVAVAFLLLLQQLLGVFRVRRVTRKFGYSLYKGYKVVRNPLFKSSFSFFNFIFVDTSTKVSDTETKLILEHELAHVKQRHWIDLLLGQILCILQWANPFAWLYLRAIKQNHEFLADEAVLLQGHRPAVYHAVLINNSLNIPAFILSNSFHSGKRLNRISMMKKPRSGQRRKLIVLSLIPVLVFFTWAFARPKYVAIKPPLAKDKTSQVRQEVTEDHRSLREAQEPERKSHTLKSTPAGRPRDKGETTPRKSDPDQPESKEKKEPASDTKAAGTIQLEGSPLYLLEGKEIASLDGISPADIESISVFKDKDATLRYGEKGKNGVILIELKKK